MNTDKEKRLKKLWWSLFELTSELGDLNSRDVVHMGISFFGTVGIDCAPTEQEGKEYMINIINNLEFKKRSSDETN